LGENPKSATALNSNKLYSKYGSQYTFMAAAPLKKISKPTIEFLRDTVKGNQHLYKIKITPNRGVNRYDIFVNNDIQINNLKANGVQSIDFKSNIPSKTKGKLLTYYVVDNLPLELEFSTLNTQNLDLNLVESSFDLLANSLLKMTQRKSGMIPMPFVLNDAIIIEQKIKPSPKVEKEKASFIIFPKQKDSITVEVDSIKR
jgi:hypothetical protein